MKNKKNKDTFLLKKISINYENIEEIFSLLNLE